MIPPVIVPITSKEITSAIKTIIINDKTKIPEFEQMFAKYVGVKHAILTYSGRTALYVLLKAYGLNKDDEIIMPAYMCKTVTQLILDAGYNLKFVDIDETFNLDPVDLKEKISKNTKAVLAVHMYGNPCDMHTVRDLCEDYSTIVIEDSAQTIGARYRGSNVGTLGDSAFFSFGRGKPITTMGGGTITTNDDYIARRVREITSSFMPLSKKKHLAILIKLIGYSTIRNSYIYRILHKRVRGDSLRTSINLDNLGYKFTEMQAAVLIEQLSKLNRFNEMRIKNARLLTKNLRNMEKISPPKIIKDAKPFFLRLPIYIKNTTAYQIDKLMQKLKKVGIDSSVVYPISLTTYFNRQIGECPNAEYLANKILGLPIHPCVKKGDIEKTTDIIEHSLGR